MKSDDLDTTLPLAEQIVRDAWLEFRDPVPHLDSVPAFLNWLGDRRPEILEKMSRAAVARIANRLFDEGD